MCGLADVGTAMLSRARSWLALVGARFPCREQEGRERNAPGLVGGSIDLPLHRYCQERRTGTRRRIERASGDLAQIVDVLGHGQRSGIPGLEEVVEIGHDSVFPQEGAAGA